MLNSKKHGRFLPRATSSVLQVYSHSNNSINVKRTNPDPKVIDEDNSSTSEYDEDNYREERQEAQSTKNEKSSTCGPIKKFRRSIYLVLSEPKSSLLSAIFFFVLILTILISNILLIGATLPQWSYTPDSCKFCEENSKIHTDIPCVCAPEPLPITDEIQNVCMFFFAMEWILRVTMYVPPSSTIQESNSRWIWFQHLKQWSKILIRPSTIIDALAVFPYFLERYLEINGLMALRLLRVFRLFLLLRLGSFSTFFQVMINVMVKSLISLYILLLGLAFGAAFFGSMIYFCERGEWQYTTLTDPPSYRFIRSSVEPNMDGTYEEISPFKSIPGSFWWFIVTATTVGYGDYYPTSWPGKCVASLAMVAGLIVVAFPVSIFCELWSKELETEEEKSVEEENIESNDLIFRETTQEKRNSTTVLDYMFSKDETNKPRNESQSTNTKSNDFSADGLDSSKTSEHKNDDISHCPNNNDIGITDQRTKSQGIVLRRSDIDSLSHHLSRIDTHQKEIHKSQSLVRSILQNISNNSLDNTTIQLKDPMACVETKTEIN